MPAVRRHAGKKRIREIDLTPRPHAVDRIAGDIGGIKRPEWSFELEPSTKPQRIGLAGSGVAGIAATRKEHASSPPGIAG